MSTPKEVFYDERIFPLMTQIIALCREAKINMVADFSLGHDDELDEALFCTTCMSPDSEDHEGAARVRRAYQVLNPKPRLFAITIVHGEK